MTKCNILVFLLALTATDDLKEKDVNVGHGSITRPVDLSLSYCISSIEEFSPFKLKRHLEGHHVGFFPCTQRYLHIF